MVTAEPQTFCGSVDENTSPWSDWLIFVSESRKVYDPSQFGYSVILHWLMYGPAGYLRTNGGGAGEGYILIRNIVSLIANLFIRTIVEH